MADVDIVLRAIDKASGGINGVNRSLGNLNATAGHGHAALGKIGSLLGGAVKMGAAAAAVGIGALAGVIGDGIRRAADMQQQLADIASVMGTTRAEIEPLKNLITQLGMDPKLKVNATEAADAIQMLARNGLSMTEILDGAARSTVLLANATNADFGVAADVATDVMAQFKISAEDMADAVNGITAVTTNSKFTIDDYRLALANGGAIASKVGVEFGDFNVALAATASSFSSGMTAGTAMKTFLNRLSPTAKPAKAAMAELGLSFYDAAGNMKSMADISEELKRVFTGQFTVTQMVGGATADMTKAAEKAAAKMPKLTTKLGEQQGQMAILQRELAGVIDKYGAGSTQADKKRLAIEKLNNRIAETRGQLGDYQAAMGAVEGATAQAITSTRQLTEQERAHYLEVIFGTEGQQMAAALAEVGADAFNDLAAAMGQTNAELMAAERMNTVSGQWEIFMGIVEGISTMIGDAFLPITGQALTFLTDWVSENQAEIVGFFKRLAVGIGEAVVWFRDNMVPAIAKLWGWVQDKLIPVLGKLWEWIVEKVVPALAKTTTETAEGLIPIVRSLVDWFTTKLLPAIRGIWEWFTTKLLPILQDIWKFLTDDMMPIWIALGKLFEEYLLTVLTFWAGVLKTIWQTILVPLWEFIDRSVIATFGSWAGAIDAVAGSLDWAADKLRQFRGWLEGLMDVRLPSWLTNLFGGGANANVSVNAAPMGGFGNSNAFTFNINATGLDPLPVQRAARNGVLQAVRVAGL